MGKVKMNDLIDFDGRITTIAELDNEGLIQFLKEKTWSKRTESGERDLYTANIKGTAYWFEIGQRAFESRTSKKEQVEQTSIIIENVKINNFTLYKDNSSYFIVDRSRSIDKHSDIIFEYEEEELQDWNAIDSEGRLLVTIDDMKEWNYDEYERLSGDFTEGMTVLLEWS